MIYYVVIPSIWLICAALCAFIASKKNRSTLGWFCIGFLIGIIGVIIICFVDDIVIEDKTKKDKGEIFFECKQCGTEMTVLKKDIKNIDTIVCMNCKTEISVEEIKEEYELQKNDANELTIMCPSCRMDLFYNKEMIKDNKDIECPYCGTEIKMK